MANHKKPKGCYRNQRPAYWDGSRNRGENQLCYERDHWRSYRKKPSRFKNGICLSSEGACCDTLAQVHYKRKGLTIGRCWNQGKDWFRWTNGIGEDVDRTNFREEVQSQLKEISHQQTEKDSGRWKKGIVHTNLIVFVGLQDFFAEPAKIKYGVQSDSHSLSLSQRLFPIVRSTRYALKPDTNRSNPGLFTKAIISFPWWAHHSRFRSTIIVPVLPGSFVPLMSMTGSHNTTTLLSGPLCPYARLLKGWPHLRFVYILKRVSAICILTISSVLVAINLEISVNIFANAL